MFFIMGITDGRKDLDFTQTVICDNCGKYGRYQVFMLYTVLSLFFIPTFKWNKRYYVQMSCCGTVYELNPEIGRRIAAGEDLQIRSQDMTIVNQERSYGLKHCNNCGYETTEDFDFCPKCGIHF